MIASALALAVGERSWEEMNSEMIAALSCLFFQGLIKAEVSGLAGIANVGVNISTDSLKSNQVSSNETVHETSRLRAKSSISEKNKAYHIVSDFNISHNAITANDKYLCN